MKVRVRLFGTLPQRFPDYDSTKGLEMEFPDGAKVQDLLDHLEISASEGGIVAIDNLVVQHDRELINGDSIRIFHRAFGG
jgi:sulfur carrier protein ThiS